MRHIGVFLRLHDSYDIAVAKGIIRHAKIRGDWILHGTAHAWQPLQDTGLGICDAMIARVDSEQEADQLEHLGIPIVDIAGAYARPSFHRVQNDDFSTGRRAGEYLGSLGTAYAAYCGVERVFWSRQRMLGYSEAMRITVDNLQIFERPLVWWQDNSTGAELGQWIEGLPHPVALFCCNDIAGVKAVSQAISKHIRIPDDMAILGVDDEDLLCELSMPTLSSVRLDCLSIGMRSALLVDQLLDSDPDIPCNPVRIRPKEIVERESTNCILEMDPVVARALRYIKTHVCEGISSLDVALEASVSRRTLEQRFRKARGCSLHQEITRERLHKVEQLLSRNTVSTLIAAEACGFPSVQRFYAARKASYADCQLIQ